MALLINITSMGLTMSLRLDIYSNGGNCIRILGVDYPLLPLESARQANITLSNVEFSFSITKTLTIAPNTASFQIYGVGLDAVNAIKDLGLSKKGAFKATAIMTWEEKPEAGEAGFVRSYYKPTLVGTLSGGTAVKKQPYGDYELSWSKCALYDADNTLIYSGDVVDVEETLEGCNIEAATGHYMMELPFSQRVHNLTSKLSLQISRQVGASPMDVDGLKFSTVYNYDYIGYINTAVSIIEDLIGSDPFKEFAYSGDMRLIGPDGVVAYNNSTKTPGEIVIYGYNEILQKAFAELIEKGDLNIATAVLTQKQKKAVNKNKKKKDGSEPVYAEYYILNGTVQSVLEKIVNTALATLQLHDDTFYLWNYYVTQNPRELFLQSESRPYDANAPAAENTPFSYMPASGLVVNKGRATFTTTIDTLLIPGTGVVINPDELGMGNIQPTEVYIDTVTITGDASSQVVNYSGKTTGFTWRVSNYNEV